MKSKGNFDRKERRANLKSREQIKRAYGALQGPRARSKLKTKRSGKSELTARRAN